MTTNKVGENGAMMPQPAEAAPSQPSELTRQTADTAPGLAIDPALYQTFCEQMPLGMVIYSFEQGYDAAALTIIAANAAAKSFLGGIDLREHIGERADAVFPGIHASSLSAIYAEAAQSGQMRDLGEIAYNDAAIQGWATVRVFPLSKSNVAVTFENVTERKRAMEDLQIYRQISDNIPTGIILFRVPDLNDPRAITVAGANPAANHFLGGLNVRDFIGRPIDELFPMVFETDAPALYLEVARTGEMRSLPDIAYDDGRVSGWFAINAFPLPDQCVGIAFENITERKKADEALNLSLLQEETIRAQQQALAELTTPLLTISDRTVVMPLIGTVDSRRAQQVMETLLEGVATRQAQAAIIDITGVSVVDTQVANALLRAAQAVKLLGADVILTGIRPEVAQTLVGLGVDLGGVVTRSTLQNGIAYALRG